LVGNEKYSQTSNFKSFSNQFTPNIPFIFYNSQVLFLQVDKQTLSPKKTSTNDTRNSFINSMYNVKLKDETKKLY
jgi:hypothetical protein